MYLELIFVFISPFRTYSKPDMDVFETARQGNAVAVRRTPGDRANAEAMEDFNALRHQGKA